MLMNTIDEKEGQFPESTDLNPSLFSVNGQPFSVPAEGSLGLLALGYVGLMAWRGAKRESVASMLTTYTSTLSPQKDAR